MRIVMILCVLLVMSAVARTQVDVDYGESPAASEAELFSKSVVVLRGRVEARSLETEPGPITSVYSVRVLELLKGSGVGGVIDVHRHGGLDAKNVDRDLPLFEVNDEVVLFLQRGQNGWYWPLQGPHGAFKLTDGRTHAYGKVGEVSKGHHGRPVAEFLAELRKHKK